jgi:reactive intermediate/imine deaminase
MRKWSLCLIVAILAFGLGMFSNGTRGDAGDSWSQAGSDAQRSQRFRITNPDTLARPTGYSHVAVVLGGRIVYVAGQVALDKSGKLVGEGDMRAQAQQVFENLKSAVESAGGDFNDVVKLNVYCVDFSHLAEIREVRDKFVNTKNPPASTAVQVSRLFRPDVLIEIEAVAVVK